MKVEDETLCCIHSLSEGYTTFFNGAKCIEETRGFSSVCLEKDVLETSLGAWERLVWVIEGMFVTGRIAVLLINNISGGFMEGWGRMLENAFQRACYKIRTTYPDPNNIYVPFSMS